MKSTVFWGKKNPSYKNNSQPLDTRDKENLQEKK